MRRITTLLAALSAALLAGVVVMPAATAGAGGLPSKVWVSNTSPLVPGAGRSCTQPGFSTVQSAIAGVASGGTVEICAGTYTEQLQITKSVSLKGAGESSTTIALPSADPANSTTACDDAVNTAYGSGGTVQDEISICDAGGVSMSNLTVQPRWASGACNDNLYGIFVAGGSDLTATDVNVDGGGAYPADGCQGGVAIEVGLFGLTPTHIGSGTATLKKVTVSGYQKNGITVDGAGSSATLTKDTVTTHPTAATAQNGIQISNGAKSVIKKTTVSGNECNELVEGGDSAPYQASGVLLYDAAPGTSITKSTISGNDFGLYYVSGAASEAASSTTTISKDHFTDNRYEGIMLDSGIATLAHDYVTASLSGDPDDIGILVYQYEGQPYASQATATGMHISGQSVAVEVSTDGGTPGSAPGDDLPGTFNISHSAFLTGNSAATNDTSPNFTITGVGNH
jgi:nitrous oxidase accessory protein NosD